MDLDYFRLNDIGHRVFSLSLSVRPGSVRDSMFRAEQFCKQLRASDEIVSSDRVLVLGLGPTGMTVATSLLNAGAVVEVCTAATDENLSNLQYCGHRELCPTTYDFPADQWNDEIYPVARLYDVVEHGLLAWRRKPARQLYQQIRRRFNQAVATKLGPNKAIISYGSLADLRPIQAVGPSGAEQEKFEVIIVKQNGEKLSDLYDIVILCTGPGRQPKEEKEAEKQEREGGFASLDWWAEDAMLQHPETAARKFVLIAGAGDGGVADFVRLLTGIQDPAECLFEMGIPTNLLNAIRGPNKDMWAEFPLSSEPDHSLLLNAQHRAFTAVKDAWDKDGALRMRVMTLLRDPSERPFVQLAMPCYHFAECYFGNRIAAHLLARALAGGGVGSTNGGLAPFRVGVRLRRHNIIPLFNRDGKKHVCEGEADKCAGATHRVVFSDKRIDCNNKTRAMGNRPPPIEIPEFVKECASGGYATVATGKREAVDFFRILERYGPQPYRTPLPRNISDAMQRKTSFRDVPFFYTV